MKLNRLSLTPGPRRLMAFWTSQSVLASRNQTLGSPNEAGRAGLKVFVTSIRADRINPFSSHRDLMFYHLTVADVIYIYVYIYTYTYIYIYIIDTYIYYIMYIYAKFI